MSAPVAELACSVYVDGDRLADTANEYRSSVPTALSGLSVTWGRGSVVDQPDTSTCSFDVSDKDGDASFLDLLHVGHPVEVYTSTAVVGGDPVDVAVDGGFEVTAPTDRVLPHTVTVTWTPDDQGGDEYTVTNRTLTSGTVAIPPAPWGTAAGAWDGMVPVASADEPWTVRLTLSPGLRPSPATLALALFTTPTKAAPTQIVSTVPVPAGGGVVEITAVLEPAEPVSWVGALLTESGAPAPWTAVAGTWADVAGSWGEQWPIWTIDDLQVIAPPQATRRAAVFSGRITDLEASGVDDGGVAVKVTAADLTADLANDAIGDTPWPAQPISTRVNRIRQLGTVKFAADIDAAVKPLRVTWRDVDAQPVMTLLSELAVSGDAVLWSAVHATRGFYLWYEDPATRTSLSELAWDSGRGLVVIVNDYRPTAGVVLSACEILRGGVTYTSDVSDVITRVDLTWQEQTVDDDGLPSPTEHTISVSDDAAAAEFGVRRASVSTQLITDDDGRDVANRVLARSRSMGWHADGVTWDFQVSEFDPSMVNTAITLLDGTTRIGLPLTITDLPAWAPDGPHSNLYVEGGTYTYTDGRWILALTISPAGTTGYSALWADLDPAWAWREFDPTIAWVDLWGAAAQYGSPRWTQLGGVWLEQAKTWQQLWGPQTPTREAA